MRRLFIMRKDLHMSPGKLAAQVAHCSEVYWLHFIKDNTTKVYSNKYSTNHPQYYRHPDLYNLAKATHEKGKEYFYAGFVDENSGRIVEQEPIWHYSIEGEIDREVYENYINGSITKTICEAKNKNQLLKARDKALELGLNEGKDFGLIKDKCLTELEPEEEDGTCITGIWFAPLDDEIAHTISRKYHLYME